MLIRMTTGLSGASYNLGPGDEYDFPRDEALRLISAGFAHPVAEKKTERAVKHHVREKRGRKGKADVVQPDDNGTASGGTYHDGRS